MTKEQGVFCSVTDPFCAPDNEFLQCFLEPLPGTSLLQAVALLDPLACVGDKKHAKRTELSLRLASSLMRNSRGRSAWTHQKDGLRRAGA